MKSYLLADADVECASADATYESLQIAFWGFFVLWPLLVPATYVWMLRRVRPAVHEGRTASGLPAASGGGAVAHAAVIKDDIPGSMAKGLEEQRPVFIDFTGYTCTNCRYMEASVFPLPEVASRLEQMVRTEVYTDCIQDICDEQREYQVERFETAALPFYAVLDPADDSVMGTFASSTNDPSEFVAFLDAALANYSAKHPAVADAEEAGDPHSARPPARGAAAASLAYTSAASARRLSRRTPRSARTSRPAARPAPPRAAAATPGRAPHPPSCPRCTARPLPPRWCGRSARSFWGRGSTAMPTRAHIGVTKFVFTNSLVFFCLLFKAAFCLFHTSFLRDFIKDALVASLTPKRRFASSQKINTFSRLKNQEGESLSLEKL